MTTLQILTAILIPLGIITAIVFLYFFTVWMRMTKSDRKEERETRKAKNKLLTNKFYRPCLK